MPSRRLSVGLGLCLVCSVPLTAAPAGERRPGTQPQPYSVERDDIAGLLTLRTPDYTLQHDLKRGGAITTIRLTRGRATNLLVHPVATRIEDETGALWTDLNDASARVSHRKDGLAEIVSVECRLAPAPWPKSVAWNRAS